MYSYRSSFKRRGAERLQVKSVDLTRSAFAVDRQALAFCPAPACTATQRAWRWWACLGDSHAAGGDGQPAHGRIGDEQPADEHDQSNKQVVSHRVNVDFKLLIDHVSALEYATERGTSEASNTVFTALPHYSLAAPQALQAATTAVQPREALLAAMAYREELDIANALTRARQRLRESSSRRRPLPRPAQTQPARARERLGKPRRPSCNCNGSCLVKHDM